MEQVPEFIGNMKKHLEEKNYIELGREAHKAKSSVMIMGMEDLGLDLKSLQLATINGTQEETYPQHFQKFENECHIALEELETELAKLA